MRYLPSEVWHDVLGFMCRFDLSRTVSLTSTRFSAISDEWLVKRCGHVVPPLEFRRFRLLKRGHDRSVAYRAVLQTHKGTKNIAIADVPPPAHFDDFSSVNIRYFDVQVLGFLRNLNPLFVDVKLFILCYCGPLNLAAFTQIVPLLVATHRTFALVIDCCLDKMAKFELFYQDYRHIFDQSVHLVAINYYFCDCYGRQITGSEMEREISLLLRWLQQTESPLANGKMRMLAILRPSVEFRDRLIDLALEAFLDAHCSVNFLIRFEHTDNPDTYTLVFRHTEFSIDNATTDEQCTLRQFDQQNWFLRRCPTVRSKNEEKKSEMQSEEEQKSEKELLEIWDRPVEGWPLSSGCHDKQSIILNCDNYRGIFGDLETNGGLVEKENDDDKDMSGPSKPKRPR